MKRRLLLKGIIAGLAAALVPARLAAALTPPALPAIPPGLAGSTMSFMYRGGPWSDAWQHFAMTWDGARYEAYRNGARCRLAEVPDLPFRLPEPFAHLSQSDRLVRADKRIDLFPEEEYVSLGSVGVVAAWDRALPPETISRHAEVWTDDLDDVGLEDDQPDMQYWRSA